MVHFNDTMHRRRYIGNWLGFCRLLVCQRLFTLSKAEVASVPLPILFQVPLIARKGKYLLSGGKMPMVFVPGYIESTKKKTSTPRVLESLMAL